MSHTHTLWEPAQATRMSRFHKSHLLLKVARPQIEPGMQTHTLCEPAQSKRMSRFHKSHVIRKFTGQMPRPSWIPQAGPTLCASLCNRNAHRRFTRDIRRATLDGKLQEKCRAPDCAQNADRHFVRVCAIEMQVKISQEPRYTEIYRTNATAQLDPTSGTRTL